MRPYFTGHAVVLLNTSDRAAPRRVAASWIAFAGRFDTRRGAVRRSESLGGRYPGAYVQLVRPVS
jgi:hypothetical protein